jgi:ribosomal protein S9
MYFMYNKNLLLFYKIKHLHYFRRKSSVAKVTIFHNYTTKNNININGQHCTEYLQHNPSCGI